MSTSKLLGVLTSCEKWVSSLETRTNAQDKQSLILQKLQEQWSSFVFITVDDMDFIINPLSLHKYLTRVGSGGMTQKKWKRLLNRVRILGSLNWNEKYSLVIDLIDLGIPVKRIFGTSISSSGIFHYVQHKTRFEHCLGLSDAVHMSLFNLGVKVCFPQKSRISSRTTPLPLGKRVYYKSLESKGSFIGTKWKSTQRRFLLLIHYLRVFPKGLEEKDYVKLIKLSLNGLFSTKMDQELPEGYEEFHIPIFPKGTQDRLDRALKPNKALRVRFYFNLIQSKALCAPVGEDMIEEAYEKHCDSLCRPKDDCLEVPEEFLKELREYGRNVGREISKNNYYDPFSTKYPNTRATLECTGRKGGAAEALRGERTLCQGSRHADILCREVGNFTSCRRMEPFVIGLIGPPGSGKTTFVEQLRGALGRKYFPNVSSDDLVYSRSCSTKHWDGYQNQPIVVLDDFGQNLGTRDDIVEFEQLVSTNRYLVPMAELMEKGKNFNSPIIIVTTNCAYGTPFLDSSGHSIVEESTAVWRRIKVPLLLSHSASPCFGIIDSMKTLFHSENFQNWEEKYAHSVHTGSGGRRFEGNLKLRDCKGRASTIYLDGCERLKTYEVIDHIFDKLSSHVEYDRRFLAPEWTQKIESQRVRYSTDEREYGLVHVSSEPVEVPYLKEDLSLYQTFSSLPPGEAPRVKAIALAEPLKVRMITVAESEVKCLQPLQMALFKYLRDQPQFCLSNGCTKSTLFKDFFDQGLSWVERIESQIKGINHHFNGKDFLWLSGDYTAATDNFPMSVTEALLEGILEFIPHPATKAWARYECSPHVIEYPKGKLGEQTSGQLMGSLLSFPLLCFLNDFIVSRAGFPKGSYLINGDDVVAKGPMSSISTWRASAPQVGLSLSLGKNFIDPDFCTVNSQLFFKGECQHTGKVSCQTRDNATIGYCFQETQFYFGVRDEVRQEFIRRNIRSLRKTVRSLRVDASRGGLALVNDFEGMDRKEQSLAIDCYLYDRLKPFMSSLPVPGFTSGEEDLRRNGGMTLRAIPVPCLTENHESVSVMNRLRSLFTEDSSSSTESEDLSRGDLVKCLKKVEEKCPGKLKKLRDTPIQYLPKKESLGLYVKYIFVNEKMVSWILRESLDIVLHLLEKSFDDSIEEIDMDMVDVLIEEIEFSTGCSELNSFINEHFYKDHNLPQEETVDLDQEDINPDLLYDITPRRVMSKTDWLKSILQISEFAPTTPECPEGDSLKVTE